MTGTVILNIVIVLGIIIAGGFLIFFMGDLLMSLCNPKKDKKTVKNKKEKEEEKIKEEIENLSPEAAEQVKQMPEVANLVYGGVVVEAYNPEEEEKTEEMAEEEAEEVEETTTEEPATQEETSVEETDEEEEAEEEDKDDIIAARRRELMERLARMSEEEEGDEEEETEEEGEEEAEEETEEETVDVDEVTEETPVDTSKEELEAARRELEEVKARNAKLLAELEAAKTVQTDSHHEVSEVLLSEEDYLARLAQLEENLKANEKELRVCKKEYIPLKRVKRTLENDEKKLRRKEALVAKQKVVLYGVNNYSDIDEEKAKKLAEDLDLYDGLKLSVEHCKEVMDKNVERYPLLEKMYDILTAQNNEIKADIERTNEELAKVRAKKDGSED